MTQVPANLLYTKKDEWVKKVDGNKVKIGITDYAQDALGDIVYLELPEVGSNLDMDDIFGEVESVKAVSELFSPVSGEVTAVNEALEDTPEILNKSPYDDGWIIEIALSKPAELEGLMTNDAYQVHLDERD